MPDGGEVVCKCHLSIATFRSLDRRSPFSLRTITRTSGRTTRLTDLHSSGATSAKAGSGVRLFFLGLIALPSPGLASRIYFAEGSPERRLHHQRKCGHGGLARNRAGPQRRLVSGLDKDDFQVYEDGVLQQIKYFSHEDIPVTVGLVVDNSGSMRPKRADVIAAALAFARSSNPQDQMFVVNFNEKVSFGLPVNTTVHRPGGSVGSCPVQNSTPDGETALYDAVAAALEHLKKGNRDKKVLIVISDGGDNASKHKLAEIMAMAGQSDAIIYTIGIFDEQDADRNPGCSSGLPRTRAARPSCRNH